MVPARSTTATAIVSSDKAWAAAVITAVTSGAVRIWAVPPAASARPGDPRPQRTATAATTWRACTRTVDEPGARLRCLRIGLLCGAYIPRFRGVSIEDLVVPLDSDAPFPVR